MARVHHKTGDRRFPLTSGWEVAEAPPGLAAEPGAAAALPLRWLPAQVPGTVASALRAAGVWSLQGAGPPSFDASAFWYRCRFPAPPAEPGFASPASSASSASPASSASREVLRFAGLATLADVWLNGARLLGSSSMFVACEVDVTGLLRPENELWIRFEALEPALGARRPRPRWKTRLVANQQLRWFRTTLLGRIPGWTPPVACVGPYRPVVLERRAAFTVERADVQTRVEGGAGLVEATVRLRPCGGERVSEAALCVGEARGDLRLSVLPDGAVALQGSLRVPDAPLWWPHTHGDQPLLGARLAVRLASPEAAGAPGAPPTFEVDLGRVAFRTLTLDTENGGFALRVNGVRVFCRGACWTTQDLVTLAATRAELAASLEAARAAGMNMLRVGGTMVYEDDAFYELCDALGILVWQDFMFANLDYPFADEAFLASVKEEAAQFLDRTQASPCLAVLCGNSEIEQQVAMLGLPRELWSSPLFQETLPAAGRALRPDVPYWPSSPSGGALPFQVDAGVSHYYGVGAYLRPLDDARRSGVRFTSECLAFSNIPEDRTVELTVGPGQSPVHHPAWKARVPRDSGAGWDFEDVRDHYLAALFGVDPMRLRYADLDRYLALGRVTTGEAMASAFSEWRRRGSTCAGGLVWFYRDLWPGAGWGVVDSEGVPKAAYHYLKRVLAPVALLLTDEGLNGLALHAVNETAAPLAVGLRLVLYRHGETPVAEGERAFELPARGCVEVRADALLGRFVDTTYAYRFGPPGHDVAVATLRDASSGATLGQACHFPLGLGSMREADLGLEARGEQAPDGSATLTVSTRRFAQSVAVDAPGFLPADSYFHLAPGASRTLALTPSPERPAGAASALRLQGTVRALNGLGAVKIVVRPAPAV